MHDPLVDGPLPNQQPYVDSYWRSTFAQPSPTPELEKEISTDVAIIGGGYTGLSAATYLHRQGVDAVLLEANQVGWGCSGRNAGFLLPGSGRLDYFSLAKKYGVEAAESVYAEFYQSLDTVDELMQLSEAKADLTQGGYLKIAHSESAAKSMRSGWEALPPHWRKHNEYIAASEIKTFIPNYKGHGALYREAGQGLNPLKYATALGKYLVTNGISLFCNSPVQYWQKSNGMHLLKTPKGLVKARKVIIAANAYGTKHLHGICKNQFPVLSSVMVTSPLAKEVSERWQAGLMAMDTRSLKYYYRLLPDNRLLFGGRGAITGKNADSELSQQRLFATMKQYFPTLHNLTMDFFWSGWVSVSADNIPHVTTLTDDPSVSYGTGYCGSGVAFASHAGKRLAQMQYEKTGSNPIYTKPIPTFPFAQFRRLGLAAFYAWHRMMN